MSAILSSVLKGPFSTEVLIGAIFIALVIGFFIKSGLLFKQRRRILRLEDEMLNNHARILSLEKRVSDQKKSKQGDEGSKSVSAKGTHKVKSE
jgi:hypothetical protein